MSCRFQTFQAFGIIPRSFASWVGFLMDSPRKDGYKLGRWDWRYTMAVVISALLFQALEINRSCSSSKLSGYISPRKGRHQGPQITYLQFCWFLVIFFFAVINDFYWKDTHICIHFIKYTYLFHFPWRIYTSMGFSDATPGGGSSKKIYI